jgi:hypothetical protein
MVENSERIVGHYTLRTGLQLTTTTSHPSVTVTGAILNTKDYTGTDIEVVLTNALILEKAVCVEFLKHASIMADTFTCWPSRCRGGIPKARLHFCQSRGESLLLRSSQLDDVVDPSFFDQ